MKNKLILLTNDDGIKSSGLNALRTELNQIAKVVCFAPTEASSAISKALTFHKPITYSTVAYDDGTKGYSTTGSPADNVLVGFHVLKRKPDLVGLSEGCLVESVGHVHGGSVRQVLEQTKGLFGGIRHQSVRQGRPPEGRNGLVYV